MTLYELLIAAGPLLPMIGFFWANCPCCEGCTLADDFTSLNPNWQTEFATANIYVAGSTAGGSSLYLEEIGSPTVGQGSVFQTFARPALDGFYARIDSYVIHTTGITAGSTDVAFNMPQFGFFDLDNHAKLTISPPSASMTLTLSRWDSTNNTPFANVTLATGLTGNQWRLGLEIIDDSSGAGTYLLNSYLDGVLVDSRSWDATIPDPLPLGYAATDNGEWQDLCITLKNTKGN